MKSRRVQPLFVAMSLAAVLTTGTSVHAQLAISANDAKQQLVDGRTVTVPNPPADTITIIDLSVFPPQVRGELKVPSSVAGPPQSVAITADERLALITSATMLDPADATKVIPDDKLTVVDLRASPHAVIATLQAGKGAAGVSVNKAGTLALVANRAEGTISIFKIDGMTVSPAGKIAVGDAKSGPSHVVFTPDGASAYVTRDGDYKISVLSIEGDKVEYTKRDLAAGLRPYGIDVSSAGDIAAVANIGLGGGDADTVSMIDLRLKPSRVVNTYTVGQTPEGLKLSSDGKFLAVNVMNGSNKPNGSPFFNDHGLLQVYAVEGTTLSKVAEAKVGKWCQGIAWSNDGKAVLAQCMVEKEIFVFRFDGKSLSAAESIKTSGGPAGIGTAQR